MMHHDWSQQYNSYLRRRYLWKCLIYSPRKFLRKRAPSSGRLSIREDADGDCTENNYLEVA